MIFEPLKRAGEQLGFDVYEDETDEEFRARIGEVLRGYGSVAGGHRAAIEFAVRDVSPVSLAVEFEWRRSSDVPLGTLRIVATAGELPNDLPEPPFIRTAFQTLRAWIRVD